MLFGQADQTGRKKERERDFVSRQRGVAVRGSRRFVASAAIRVRGRRRRFDCPHGTGADVALVRSCPRGHGKRDVLRRVQRAVDRLRSADPGAAVAHYGTGSRHHDRRQLCRPGRGSARFQLGCRALRPGSVCRGGNRHLRADESRLRRSVELQHSPDVSLHSGHRRRRRDARCRNLYQRAFQGAWPRPVFPAV